MQIINHNKNRKLVYFAKLDKNKILKEFNTSETGLTKKEANKRIKKYGLNTYIKEKNKNPLFELLLYFNNPLIIILIIAAIIAMLLKDITDSTIILIIISISATINFLQEHNTNKALDKLKQKIATTSTVIRNNIKKEIPIKNIVPGDIIFLSAGDIIPADARIIKCNDFFVNQSSFTGESYPKEKISNEIKEKDPSLTDLNNIVFSGTTVISGSATALILFTGKNTQFGKIAEKLESKPIPSDFEKGLNKFSYFIMKITIFMVLFVFLFKLFFNNNDSLINLFLFAIAVAIGIMPSLLPMILSITMVKGSLEMSKKGVFVQRLESIPNFGTMDILCTDKTGTLTENKILLFKAKDLNEDQSDKVLLYGYINSFFQTGLKNPIDKAVLESKKIDLKKYKKIDEIPFDFIRKRLSIIVEKDQTQIMITKGAPEEIIRVCNYYYSKNKMNTLTPEAKIKINRQYNKYSNEGYRVLAIAIKTIVNKKENYSIKDEKNLMLIGFLLFFDPPKHDVPLILKKLNKSGIKIKILTGDNELVTKKICQDIGLNIEGILTGKDLDKLSDDALKIRAENTTIFARFSPEDKNRIISVLKSNGHIVGYMGDGINDAPSIKTADVGISVNNAVDVAKSTADIILTHKSLKELINGVYEGRKIFVNTMKYLIFTLSSNFGNMLSVVGAVIYLPFLPMLPSQILLNNLLSDISQMTISTDNVDFETLEKPKKWHLNTIKKFMYVFGPVSSLFDFITFFTLFSIFNVHAKIFQTSWFLESLATQILVIHIMRTKKIPFIESKASKLVLITTFSVLILGWIIPFTPLALLFNFKLPPLYILTTIILIVITYLYFTEIIKHYFYKKYDVL